MSKNQRRKVTPEEESILDQYIKHYVGEKKSGTLNLAFQKLSKIDEEYWTPKNVQKALQRRAKSKNDKLHSTGDQDESDFKKPHSYMIYQGYKYYKSKSYENTRYYYCKNCNSALKIIRNGSDSKIISSSHKDGCMPIKDPIQSTEKTEKEREVYIRAEEYAKSNERPGPAKIFERMIKDKIELGVKDMYVDIKIAKAVHKRFLDSPEVQKPIPEKTASPEGKLFCRFSHTTPKYVFWFFFSEDQQKVISDFIILFAP